MSTSIVAPVTGHAPSVTAPTAFYIPSLDGIRAIAIGIVFLAHVRNGAQGMFGVTLFFFLSGYLITTLLRQEHATKHRISLGRFYLRRILRILPPFYLTLGFLVLVLLGTRVPKPFSLHGLLAFAMFGGNYWMIFHNSDVSAVFHPLWSLAVEEHFYLVFPFLFILMCRARLSYRMQGLLLAAISGGILAWRVVLALHPSSVTRNHLIYGSDTRIDSILFGCIMALAFNPVMDKHLKLPNWLALLGGIALLASFLIRDTFYRQTMHYTLQGVALIPIFAVLITKSDSWFRWLNVAWVKFVGVLSYTIYLVHRCMIAIISAHTHSFIVIALGAGSLSLGFALLMNKWVERPLIQVRRRLA